MNYYSHLLVFPISIPIYWRAPVCKVIKRHITWHAAFHKNSFRGSPVPNFKNIKKCSEAYTSHVTYMQFLWYKALHDLQRRVKYRIQLFFSEAQNPGKISPPPLCTMQKRFFRNIQSPWHLLGSKSIRNVIFRFLENLKLKLFPPTPATIENKFQVPPLLHRRHRPWCSYFWHLS